MVGKRSQFLIWLVLSQPLVLDKLERHMLGHGRMSPALSVPERPHLIGSGLRASGPLTRCLFRQLQSNKRCRGALSSLAVAFVPPGLCAVVRRRTLGRECTLILCLSIRGGLCVLPLCRNAFVLTPSLSLNISAFSPLGAPSPQAKKKRVVCLRRHWFVCPPDNAVIFCGSIWKSSHAAIDSVSPDGRYSERCSNSKGCFIGNCLFEFRFAAFVPPGLCVDLA